MCTVKNSWWWTEELSETCRVSFQKYKFWEISSSTWFYYKKSIAASKSHTSNCWLPYGTKPNDARLTRSNWLHFVVVPSGHAIAVSQGLGHYRSYKVMVRRKLIISIVRKSWSNEHNRQEGEMVMADRERKLLRWFKNRTWPPVSNKSMFLLHLNKESG